MDPVTLIVSAIALGASAGLTETAATAVKDAYASLKHILGARYGGVDVGPVEKKPDSNAKRDSLKEDLADSGAGDDEALLAAAREVIAQVAKYNESAGAAIGIDLHKVRAVALRARNIDSEGTGVRVQESIFSGDIDISDVKAGPRGQANP